MNKDLFLIGVDGGGTGTRIVLADAQGRELAQAASGPSGLAWRRTRVASHCGRLRRRHSRSAGVALDWSRCVLGCGLAGVNNRDWLAAFLAQAPALAGLAVESDAYTTLLGAHGGAHGVIVALGTGSIAAAADHEGGECRIVGGYGFPSGDEASGARLGVRAIVHAQHALDGRGPNDDLAQALLAHVGASDRDEPYRVALRGESDGVRESRAGRDRAPHASVRRAAARRGGALKIGKMIAALDPSASRCRLRLCGGLGRRCANTCRRPTQARACASHWRTPRTAACGWRSGKPGGRRVRVEAEPKCLSRASRGEPAHGPN